MSQQNAHITFPVFSLKENENEGRLVRWLVADGEHVYFGQDIYETKILGEGFNVASLDTGYIWQTVPDNTVCKSGDIIARMVQDEFQAQICTMSLYLRHGEEFDAFKRLCGDVPPEKFIRQTFLKMIGLPPDEDGKGPMNRVYPAS